MQKFIFFFKIILIFSSAILACASFASTQACQPIGLQGSTIHLSTTKPVYIVFHNTSMHNLYVTHESASGLSSLIEPDKWSLLVLVDKTCSLSCVESVPGHEQLIPCESAVTLCQLTIYPKTITETKWLAENTAQLPNIDP